MSKAWPCALTILAAWLAQPAWSFAQQDDSCVTCHAALGDERLSSPVTAMPADVHGHAGFSCVACHGGDASELGMAAMSPERGYIGVPEPREVAQLCGRCHSDAQFMRRYDPNLRVDQVAEYRTSVHGERLTEYDDTNVATCVSCHPAHSIKPPSDPTSSVHPLNVAGTCGACHADAEYMASYSIPTDQREKYERSIHYHMLSEESDLSAPTCNDCHGNHGAAPPGISWVGNVCGQCHMVMGELFAASFHSRIMNMLGRPGCATCHKNHDIQLAGDELLGLGEGATCQMCHSESSNGGAAAMEMRGLIDTLVTEFEAADSVLNRAENAGMEVSEAQFALGDARTALISARTATHSFVADSVRSEVEKGLEVTSEARSRGEAALAELQFRRIGLAVSVGIILLLIVGLVLKIRQLEGRQPATGRTARMGGA
ncbi:MAG TPA: hypothetical protein VLC48_03670 [Gemmatimonadota bacterium]|nr:hypothetical protein [Gemmatimonadota bacterium]